MIGARVGAIVRSWLNSRRESWLWHGWAALVIVVAASAFYLPALLRTGGRWPAPLDDVYIYFGYARSLALGHPFSWLPGNGYSSGATAVVYPWLLAPAWAAGLRGSALGIMAAAIAVLGAFELARCLRRASGAGPGSWLIPPLLVSIPLVDWTLFSGMEAGLFAAALGRALLATQRGLEGAPSQRGRHQLSAGMWLALMVVTRPESIGCAGALMVVSAHGARSKSAIASLLRAGLPAAVVLLLQALANYGFTGEWAQAGAVRKLILNAPYLEPQGVVLAVLRNGLVLVQQAFVRALGGPPGQLALCLALAAGLVAKRSRRSVMALLVGAAAALALVCLNSTAAYQNFRYAVPSLMMLLAACALGVARLVPRRSGKSLWRWLAALAIVTVTATAAGRRLSAQTEHFAQASLNILEQQGEMARRLRQRQPKPRRILVGDAGAIPYLAELPAIDGLGLGGMRGLPFARASLHGLPAVVELIERLPVSERPDLMALYPSWWSGVADVFGTRIDAVRIDRNVICAADEKVLYRADWSTLAKSNEQPDGTVDSLDIADLVDERAHRYRFPAPRGGWICAASLRDARLASSKPRYDAGRIIPRGKRESFVLRPGLEAGAARLWIRTDRDGGATDPVVRIEVLRGGRLVARTDAGLPSRQEGHWNLLVAELREVAGGDELRITALAEWRSHHIWLIRPRVAD